MSLPAVVFVDTSVIVRLIGIDGEQLASEVAAEFERRREAGQRFVLPVTALVEAGNRVAQQSSERRRFAERLRQVIEAASQPNPPWILHQATLDQQFAQELLAGDSTGSDLTTLLADGRLGTGDVAILVERDQFKSNGRTTGTTTPAPSVGTRAQTRIFETMAAYLQRIPDSGH